VVEGVTTTDAPTGMQRRLYQFTAIDDYTRIRVLKIYDACNQRTARLSSNEKLREWEDYYNHHRPHGALGGEPPYERLLARTRGKALPKA